MIDRLLALISLALLIGFCAFLGIYVQRIDLRIILGICVLMAAYDLLIYEARNGKAPARRDPQREE